MVGYVEPIPPIAGCRRHEIVSPMTRVDRCLRSIVAAALIAVIAPPAMAVEEEASNAEEQDETEIEISVSSEGEASPIPNAERSTERAKSDASATDRADSEVAALRDEVHDKHARLSKITFYELLDVERDAPHAQIKRA